MHTTALGPMGMGGHYGYGGTLLAWAHRSALGSHFVVGFPLAWAHRSALGSHFVVGFPLAWAHRSALGSHSAVDLSSGGNPWVCRGSSSLNSLFFDQSRS